MNPNKPRYSAAAKPKADQNIVAKIIDAQVDFSRKDIKKWRNALEMACDVRSPMSSPLQDLYADLGMDGHLQANILIRKSSVLNTEFHIYDAEGKINQTLDKFISREWTYRLITQYMDALFFGTSVVEISALTDAGLAFHTIPAKHVLPKQGKILLDAYSSNKYILLADFPQSLIPLTHENPLGIINNVVPQLIWKRHAQQSWAEFSEKFGVPMVVAITNLRDKSQMNALENRLGGMGESSTLIMPTGTNVDIKQPSNTDAYAVFLERVKVCNEEISKQVVGGTMLADNGSSKSQSEVHERTLDERIALSDMRSIEFFFNDVLFPVLRQYWGSPIPEDNRFGFDKSNKLSDENLIKLVEVFSPVYDLDENWIGKTFNIPLKKKPLSEQPVEASYNATLGPKASTYFCCAPVEAIANVPISINALISQLTKIIFAGDEAKSIAVSALYTVQAAQLLSKAFGEGWKLNSGIDYDSPDYIAYQAMQMNVFQFSAAKSIAQLQALNNALLKPDGTPRSFAEFKAQAESINAVYNKAYLNTEYNHAIAVGQSMSAYYAHQANKANVRYVTFHTMGDAKVRASHAALNGRIFDLNEKGIGAIYPPLAWACRCELIPSSQTNPQNVITTEQAFKVLGNTAPEDFKIDRANAKEVFTQNQMYIKQVALNQQEKAIARMNDLTYEDYGLPDKIASDTPLRLNEGKTIDQTKTLFEAKKDSKNNVVYTDYLNRKMVLKENNFLIHIGDINSPDKEKYLKENRHLLWDHIQDVVEKPSELYLQGFGGKNNGIQQLKYLKQYEDKTLVVIAQQDKNNVMEIMTWFADLKTVEVRSGFLVQKSEK